MWVDAKNFRAPSLRRRPSQLKERIAEAISLMIEDIEEEHAKNPGKTIEVTV